MRREINPKIDRLVVEGLDDRAVVNTLVTAACPGVALGKDVPLVKTHANANDAWALSEFDEQVTEAHADARIGLILDRDGLAGNDKWPKVQQRIRNLQGAADAPTSSGVIVDGRFGVWMWPDNVSVGDLEMFLDGILAASPALAYATEASRIAKADHGAEYDLKDARKAALKVRSLWFNASAAAGYGHIVRALPLTETPASRAFLAWFTTLFLT
jgi:hypothetical protein